MPRIFSALLAQEKRLWFFVPISIRPFLNSVSVAILQIALTKASVSSGSINTAESCSTSGKDAALDAITGHPHACASKTGIPNPSYKEGNRNAIALEYSFISCSSPTLPINLIPG